VRGQEVVWPVDNFDPRGTHGHPYSAGEITNVWSNWFGNAFNSLSWDPDNDGRHNPASGSMKIELNFSNPGPIPNQFEVYDGPNGIAQPTNGFHVTGFQCDIRFAAGSATVRAGNQFVFGYVEFGVGIRNGQQDYFGGIGVPASNTNWVHVNIKLDAKTNDNLYNISNVLIHMWGPHYGNPGLRGRSTLWVDNIKFTGVTPPVTNCTVDWNKKRQRIDGFGSSSAWEANWTTNQADLVFSTNRAVVYSDSHGHLYTNNGVGFSLLRSRVGPADSTEPDALPTTYEAQIMQWAQARGTRVWSTPWTPPAGFKSTNDIYDQHQSANDGLYGGSFLGGASNNLAYASQLANYAVWLKTNYGVNLYAISIQNEPDSDGNTYEHCQWTGAQFRDFIPYLRRALVAKGVGSTKIMLPESEGWRDDRNLAGPALADRRVAAEVEIIGNHNYDGGGFQNLARSNFGKALWETEISRNEDLTYDTANGVYYAQRIFLFMTVAQANSWNYWWTQHGLFDTNAVPAKRLFAIGNYARFVRPGDYRIDVVNHNPFTFISAYKDLVSGQFAIVAANPERTAITQTFNLAHFTADSVTPWITSAEYSLDDQAPLPVDDGSFTFSLPPMSVVTFAGQGHDADTESTSGSAN
jgi:glucuronoarabinoxylan endo-1,4-beta-xylanase